MTVYQSSEQLLSVLQEVFNYVIRHPEHVQTFIKSNLVIRILLSEPELEVLLDGREPADGGLLRSPARQSRPRNQPRSNLLHRVWMGIDKSTQQSFLSGKIRTKGNLLKAMSLTEIFLRAAERIYPAVAVKYGLTPTKSTHPRTSVGWQPPKVAVGMLRQQALRWFALTARGTNVIIPGAVSVCTDSRSTCQWTDGTVARCGNCECYASPRNIQRRR